MPEITDVVNPHFRFPDFIKKRLQGVYFFRSAEGWVESEYVWKRGWVVCKPIDRKGFLGKLIDILLQRHLTVAFVCNLKGYGAFLRVYDPDLFEEFADMAEEFEQQYPNRKILIESVIQTKK